MGHLALAALRGAVKPRVRTFLLLGIVGVPLVVGLGASQILTEFLWFRELGQEDAFVRIQEVKLLLILVVGGFTAFFLIGNAWLAIRHAPTPVPRRYLPAAIVGCGLIAALIGLGARGDWQVFLLWVNGQTFGFEDPLHHRDVGFFVFSLPFLLKLSNLLILIAAIGSVVAIVIHVLTGAVNRRPLRATYPARVHLALLGSLALLLLAWRLHLATFSAELQQIDPGDSQPFPGPHYIDVNVRVLGLRILSYVAVAAAIGLAAAPFLAARGRGLAARRAAIYPIVALGATALVSQSWAPTLVQHYVVDPDPVAKQLPYLDHAIAGTRRAFGLSAVDVHTVVPKEKITPADVRRERDQLDNVQLWDSNILQLQMQQLASDTPFYRSTQSTLDAVPTRDGSRLTVIGERELDVDRASGAPEGWANTRLAYTHGYGAFRFSATEINRTTARPVSDDRALPIRQPRIYFGNQQPDAPDWVVANTRRPEFDQPTAADVGASTYHYRGPGGIAMSNPLLRAAFALRLDFLPLLTSEEFTSDSRIILHRDVLDRLGSLAPFIRWDPNPAALIVDGRIVFLTAGYAVSDSYPYSQRIGIAGSPVSYARLAVQATVDAYSGRVRLYAVDQEDPILRAWDAAFPGMFEPISRMPRAIRERMRYPPALFDAQAQLYQQFHTTDRNAFASGADEWTMPTSLSGPIEVAADIRFDEDDEDELRNRMTPSYRFGTPAGVERPRLLRSAYYSPGEAQNLVATLDGWIDREGELNLSSRSLPRDRVTLGPAQVSRLVFVTPRVANSLGVRNKELRDVGESSIDTIWLGNPHIVFFAGGFLQIQTVYDVSNGRGVAKMFGVTAFLNGRAGIGDTVTAALRQAINLAPEVGLGRLPSRVIVDRTVPIRFRVTNGLAERIRISSSKGTVLSRRLRVRSGPAAVEWTPEEPGRFRVSVSVRGVDGSVVDDTRTVTVRPGPPGAGPTAQFTELPRAPVVGRPTRIEFKVSNAVAEIVRIESKDGSTVTWKRQVRAGRGAVMWVPNEPGRVRLETIVRGTDGQSIELATDLTVRKRSPRSTGGQQAP